MDTRSVIVDPPAETVNVHDIITEPAGILFFLEHYGYSHSVLTASTGQCARFACHSGFSFSSPAAIHSVLIHLGTPNRCGSIWAIPSGRTFPEWVFSDLPGQAGKEKPGSREKQWRLFRFEPFYRLKRISRVKRSRFTGRESYNGSVGRVRSVRNICFQGCLAVTDRCPASLPDNGEMPHFG